MTRNVIRTRQGEKPTNTSSGPCARWADALFVSMLQRSDRPNASQARQAIASAVRAYGGRGCAGRVAQEFGDHPETAVVRMRWALAMAREVLGSAPTHNSPRRRPGLLMNGPGRQLASR
jgi:hypothetical protein